MAIQVNGTTVIDNSRQLTNIASVDATTASALGTAGVGGKTTLITDSTFGTVSSVSVDFTGGHDYYRIHLKDCTHSGGASQSGFRARLKNSSGTVSGGAEYLSYRTSIGSAPYNDDFDTYFSFAGRTVEGSVKQSLMIDVINPYQSGQSTVYQGIYQSGMGNSAGFINNWVITGQLYTSSFSSSQHNGMVFYMNLSTSQNFTGGRITMWGIDV